MGEEDWPSVSPKAVRAFQRPGAGRWAPREFVR